jgi:endonuclease YncB( thermonuclease family)
MLWRAGFLALLLVFVAAWPGSAQEPITGVASVIDGDTIEIHGVRIRFFGIDAPEGGQQCRRPDGSSWRCG